MRPPKIFLENKYSGITESNFSQKVKSFAFKLQKTPSASYSVLTLTKSHFDLWSSGSLHTIRLHVHFQLLINMTPYYNEPTNHLLKSL